MNSSIGNPLEFAKEREIVKGPHLLDHNTYVPNPHFVGSEYPKFLYRDGAKPKIVANEDEELAMIEAGYSVEAPKQKVSAEDN
jgi:hypothetical protein